ncbi:MAG TPA: serine hydrolase domain-containing protein [Roseomonas sp.]
MSAFSEARLARIAPALRAHVDRGAVAGLVALIARRDAVHVEAIGLRDIATAAPMRRDSLFRVASMTKTLLAAAAMTLVEETRLRLDDPLDPWLPELADRRVLRHIDSPLDDTVPAHRAITLRDLLTLRLGLGVFMAMPGTWPIQAAMAAAGVEPGPDAVPFGADEFMRRLGTLPLAHQPGAGWLYHTGYDVLAVLLARVTGMALGDLLAERILAPLGMADTGFQVPAASLGRLTTAYRGDGAGGLAVQDDARDSVWSRPPAMPTEVVATADDFLAFGRMLLAGGRHGGRRILSRASVALMLTDQVTRAQKDAWPFFPGFWDGNGWGFGGAVTTRRDDIAASPGRYGWHGGFGTTFMIDPREEMVVILLTQRLMQSADDGRISNDALTLAYQAIGD